MLVVDLVIFGLFFAFLVMMWWCDESDKRKYRD